MALLLHRVHSRLRLPSRFAEVGDALFDLAETLALGRLRGIRERQLYGTCGNYYSLRPWNDRFNACHDPRRSDFGGGLHPLRIDRPVWLVEGRKKRQTTLASAGDPATASL